jgi:MFS transporter, ACS family, tartrate transporter
VVSTAMCLIAGAKGFFALRFLLGVAEAGFFPGVIFFLVQWFPKLMRARMISLFMIGMPLSSVIGAPVSTFILTRFDGVAGLTGWQWLFITEGVPTVLLGLACFFVLADRPATAAWLEPRERDALQAVMDSERREVEAVRTYSTFDALTNGRVMLLSLLFFMVATGMYGAVFWVPQIVKSFGVSNLTVGFITAIPYLLSVIAMVWWGRHADRRGELIWHVAIPTLVSAAGFTTAGLWIGQPLVAMLGLSAGCVGMYSTAPVFWTLATSFLTGRAVAGAVALITSLGNLSGIVVPPIIGWSRDATGGFSSAMIGLGAALLLAALLTFACGAVQRNQALQEA